MGLSQIWLNLQDNNVKLETLGYLFFISFIIVFFVGSRVCEKYDKGKKELLEVDTLDDLNPNKSLKDGFCENRNTIVLNMGVLFLVFTVVRSYYSKFTKKLKK